MKLCLELPVPVAAWAEAQPDPEQAVLEVLKRHVSSVSTPLFLATRILTDKAPHVPEGMEFEIPQIIGGAAWEELSRSERLRLGKEVKREPEKFGLEFVRKSTSNHAIYRRKV